MDIKPIPPVYPSSANIELRVKQLQSQIDRLQNQVMDASSNENFEARQKDIEQLKNKMEDIRLHIQTILEAKSARDVHQNKESDGEANTDTNVIEIYTNSRLDILK